MSGLEVVFRAFRPGDEVAINDGFNEAFRTRRSLAEWSWKFPPEEFGRPIMVAVHDGRVVAHYAGVPTRIAVDGQTWPAVQIVDVYSTREARRRFSRRGVWVQTVEAFFASFGASGRYPLMFGFPGRRQLRIGVLQLGYDELELQPIAYLRRPRDSVRGSARRLPYRAELARDWEPRLDRLWTRARHSYPVAAVRDAEHGLRRLAGRPGVVYHRFLVFPRLSNEPVAFAAFRTDSGRCRWVDLLWDHGHPGAVALLSRVAGRLAVRDRADCEEVWLNGDPDGEKVLLSLGFEREDEPDGLVMGARAFSPQLDLSTLDKRVYLTMADADLV